MVELKRTKMQGILWGAVQTGCHESRSISVYNIYT
jgi:hypothetical protein